MHVICLFLFDFRVFGKFPETTWRAIEHPPGDSCQIGCIF